jgi:NADH:ubiquinone oxidoreductase subunit 2 (subunit N)
MYPADPEEAAEVPAGPAVGWGARVVLVVAAAATLVFGIAPWPLLEVLRDALPL